MEAPFFSPWDGEISFSLLELRLFELTGENDF